MYKNRHVFGQFIDFSPFFGHFVIILGFSRVLIGYGTFHLFFR